MRDGPVPRCPLTGLPMTGKARNSLVRLPDDLQTTDGQFKPEAFSGCNLFNVRSFAAAAGYGDVRHFVEKVLTDPSSPFHAHPIATETGRIVGYATHTTSAEWGGRQHRQKTLAVQTGYERESPSRTFPVKQS